MGVDAQATVEHMGLSQAEEVRQMLHVLQSGGGGGGGASMGLSALLPRPAEGFRRCQCISHRQLELTHACVGVGEYDWRML